MCQTNLSVYISREVCTCLIRAVVALVADGSEAVIICTSFFFRCVITTSVGSAVCTAIGWTTRHVSRPFPMFRLDSGCCSESTGVPGFVRYIVTMRPEMQDIAEHLSAADRVQRGQPSCNADAGIPTSRSKTFLISSAANPGICSFKGGHGKALYMQGSLLS